MDRALDESAVDSAMDDVRSVLTPDLLHPEWRAGWSEDNLMRGHCAAASEAAYFLLGGPAAGLTAMVGRASDGTTHWWLRRADGAPIDPTADQFVLPAVPPYEEGRPCGFMGQRRDPGSPWGFGRSPGRRAAIILERVMTLRAGRDATPGVRP